MKKIINKIKRVFEESDKSGMSSEFETNLNDFLNKQMEYYKNDYALAVIDGTEEKK